MKIGIEERVGYTIVRLEGDIVRENQGELRASVEDILARRGGGIILDLAGVGYIDSAGLGCCVGIHKLMEERHQNLAVIRPTPNVEQMLRMIRLDLIIPILDDAEKAEALVKGDPRRPAP